MQFYGDPTLYFSVLPHDLVKGYLKHFCFDFRSLRHYLSFSVGTDLVGAISFDLNGNLVVPFFDENEVRIYSRKDGTLLCEIGEGQHDEPVASVVDKNGRIYISESDCIKMFHPDGVIFENSAGLAIDDDKLYVSCWKELLILPSGRRVPMNCDFDWVQGMTVLPASKRLAVFIDDGLYIVEGDNRLHLVSLNQHVNVRQIAADVDDNIYITDDKSCQVFNTKGVLIGQLDYVFNHPTCVAIWRSTLVVVDSDGIHLFV